MTYISVTFLGFNTPIINYKSIEV